MMEDVEAVIALLVTLAVVIPCLMFGFRRRGGAQDLPESEQPAGLFATITAMVFVRDGEAPSGDADTPGEDGRAGDPRRASGGSEGPGPGGQAEDEPPSKWDVEDVTVVRPEPSQPEGLAGILRRALPWTPRAGESIPPEGRDEGPDWSAPPADDVTSGGGAPHAQAPDIHVERVDTPPGERHPPLPRGDEMPPLPPSGRDDPQDRPDVIDPDPVALEGVDMSEAPLTPVQGGGVARVPTVPQLRQALVTGGFSRLMAWLKAFRKASANTLAEAQEIHARTMNVARRTRNQYALAMQAFQAVQADKLDRQTINRLFVMLQQSEREAAAAAAATHATAALVVAAGGAHPAVADAIRTLNRNHGATAEAIRNSPVPPVPNVDWYRQ